MKARAEAGVLAVDEQAALSDGSESDLRYLMDDAGEWMVDPVESEQRAAHLYYLLNYIIIIF